MQLPHMPGIEFDTYSSSEADPSESSPPPVSVTPMRSRVALRSSSPTTSTLEIPTAPILPAPSAIVAPSSEEDIPIGQLYRTHPGGPCRALTARKSVRHLPSHRLALRYTSHHLDRFTSGSSLSHSSSDHSSSGHSILGHSLSGHTSPDTTVVDSSTPSRFVHPSLARTPWCSEAYLRWRSAPLSTMYPPTTSESSAGDSSSESSAGPSRKRCRSPAAIVTSSIHATRALVPSCANLLPPRKRFRDSISLEDSVKEDIDTDVLEDIEADATAVEVAVDRDVMAEVDAGIDMEVDVEVDVEDEVEDEVESSDRGTIEVKVDVVAGIDILDAMHMPNAVEHLKQNWKAPRTPTKVRSFLGLAGYYHRFIENFSKIAKSLTILTQKSKNFDWGEEPEFAFKTLKDKLCNAPVLALPDRPEDFVRRWIELFSDYDCEIRYHPSKANVVADALSRKERVKIKRVRAMNMILQSSIKDRILAAQKEAVNEFAGLQKGLNEMIEQRSDGTLYYLDRIWVPLKGEEGIAMDFVTKLPRTSIGHDTIWVIMDRLTKYAHFLPMHEDYKMERLARLYLNEIVARHGVPILIISDRDSRFTSRFWQSIACVLDFGGSWDVHLPLVEFSYNNSYHYSMRCAPFEALYGRKCHSPIMWAKVREGQLIGPELVQETTEKILQIKDRLKAARDRQKSYADKRRKPLEFSVGDYVLLKVSPWKGVVRFGKKGKLAPRFVGPFEIIKKVGPVAYRTRVDAKLNFMEESGEILEREFKKLKRSRIAIVKVRWNSKRGPEFTWEREDQMKLKYPHLFSVLVVRDERGRM
ncbi:putative reverse transcriptase domain-containing protein [Tanacetum coccineum]|uniref:Reverse transcriptase domain-containing protein n=1 Tax=Tanacetum coccineum TaxID=301880 RepID=A0ABQ5AZ47_9ASTR